MGFILWGSRSSQTNLTTLSPEEQLNQAFWRSEGGESLSEAEKQRLLQVISQVPDTVPRLYAQAVAYLLLYGGSLQAPPMVYVQRLQQMREDPWVLAYLGRLSAHTGQQEKAYQYLRQAIQGDSACGPAYLFLAQLSPDSACVWLSLAQKASLEAAALRFARQLKDRWRCP